MNDTFVAHYIERKAFQNKAKHNSRDNNEFIAIIWETSDVTYAEMKNIDPNVGLDVQVIGLL